MEHDKTGAVDNLEPRDCWNLLNSAKVGRLALVVAGRPEIFPVNHVVAHGAVVFRSAPGTKLAAIRGRTPVAFEVDGLDVDTGVAWSVVILGHAVRVAEDNEIQEAAALPIFPWHDTAKNWFVRVHADEISGRRFTAASATTPETTDQEKPVAVSSFPAS